MLHPDQLLLIHLLAQQVSAGVLTQIALADATGVHQSQISRILSGNVRRASKNVLKLCNYAKNIQARKIGRADVSDEILEAVSKLVGNNRAEDRALAQLVASLRDWRKSWEGSK